MDLGLKGKSAIVTASKGLGQAIARSPFEKRHGPAASAAYRVMNMTPKFTSRWEWWWSRGSGCLVR